MADDRPVAAPLTEQLRSVPRDAVLRIDTPNALGCMDTRSIPVGLLCHQAADVLGMAERCLLAAVPAADTSHLNCLEARRIDRAYAICEPCNTGFPERCLYKRPARGAPVVPATMPKCKCGQPWVLNTVHRANSPCWVAQEPPGGLGPNPDGVAEVRHQTEAPAAPDAGEGIGHE